MPLPKVVAFTPIRSADPTFCQYLVGHFSPPSSHRALARTDLRFSLCFYDAMRSFIVVSRRDLKQGPRNRSWRLRRRCPPAHGANKQSTNNKEQHQVCRHKPGASVPDGIAAPEGSEHSIFDCVCQLGSSIRIPNENIPIAGRRRSSRRNSVSAPSS